MNISDFVKGHVYRRDDLISAFKGSFMRGMNKCNRTNTLVLISKHTSNRIYGDLFQNNQLIYTGEGQKGDQTYTGANKDLLNSEENNLPVYLFVVFKNQQYTYYGRVHLCGTPYFEDELDVDGNNRKVIRFPLMLSNDFIPMTEEEMRNHTVAGIVSERKTYEVVGAAIIDDNKVLCAQRGYGQLKGKWEFPGGKVERGENDVDALKREIKEELGIEIRVKDLIEDNYHEYSNFNVNLRVYKCEYVSGVINDTEHQSLKWIENNKLEELDWADADKPILETYVSSLPRTIDGQIPFDYFEAEAVRQSDSNLLRAVQDYEKSERNKRKAGQSAELAVIYYEKDKLNNSGRPDLAECVKQVSLESSDYGYDVRSFEIVNGVAQEAHIEVKSAKFVDNRRYIEFFISENELKKFKNDPAYKVYCLLKIGKKYKLHEVKKADFFAHDYLSPMSYRVRIRIAE